MPMLRPISATLCLVALFALGCQGDQTPGFEGGNRQIKTTDLEPGSGDPIEKGDLALLEYSGALANGEVFDSNTLKDPDGNPTKPPLSTVVGSRTTVIGFDDGLVGMKKGTVRKIEIP